MKRFLSIICLSLFSLFLLPRTAFAVSEASFPVCTNPQGTIKANYASGTHGIVGSTATYIGKDTVYEVSPITNTQCFCSDSGEGIQTNWQEAGSMSDADISILKSQGWIFVPNGLLWGLKDTSYVAKNISYACQPSSSSPRIGGDWATNSSIGDPSSNGLAGTGNISFIFSLASAGFVFVALSFLLKKTNLGK